MGRCSNRLWGILTGVLRAVHSPFVLLFYRKGGAQLKRRLGIPVCGAQEFWTTVNNEKVDSPFKEAC
jgi:hypothetical protein